MRQVIVGVFLAAACSMAQADPAALARETAQHMKSKEDMLVAAVNKGERAAFERFILAPTEALQARWTAAGDTAGKYRRCQFALLSFKQFALDTWAARSPLPDDSPVRKDYKAQLAECMKILPK